ncbi:uncharacterized protein LTHEOB_7753 [Lasiodiplodia theobromae]|nr:uncharacterized protein LTHEOB_7753 [Lasiodiplodia theobromae]KAF4542071.1 hypothetical protein LTHEOB_7753 [Lasiodiplodia theobromae]
MPQAASSSGSTSTAPQAAPASDVPNPNATPNPADGAGQEGRTLPRFRFQESHWPWKLALRLITIGCAIVGMSTLIWAGVAAGRSSYDHYYYDAGSWVGALSIPLICSLIFNIICVVILFCSKRPVHPGVAVGVDLVLWLTFIVTGFFGLLGYFYTGATDPESFDDRYGSSSTSYPGYIYCESNDYIYDPSDRTCTYSPSDCPGWSSCETKEAFYEAEYRGRVILVGVIFTWICTLLHFITFVWACVDTHRRRRSKQTEMAGLAAEKIINEMIATGQLVRPAPAMVAGYYHPQGRGQPIMGSSLPTVQEFYSPAPRAPPAAAKGPEQV